MLGLEESIDLLAAGAEASRASHGREPHGYDIGHGLAMVVVGLALGGVAVRQAGVVVLVVGVTQSWRSGKRRASCKGGEWPASKGRAKARAGLKSGSFPLQKRA